MQSTTYHRLELAIRPALSWQTTANQTLHAETSKHFVFLTNNFSLPPLTITELYRYHWQVELFFKWIKQHLCNMKVAKSITS